MSENGKILVTKNLHKTYQMGRTSIPVLQGIDLEVNEAQIVAIVGPSGVGKSTLLHILGTLDRPSEGSVTIEGTDVFKFDEKKLADFRNRTVGFIFQFHHLMPEFTALENVMMPGLIAGKPKKRIRDRAKSLLTEVGLEHRVNHRPGELSGGEMQRVAVARALMNDPKLVFADEPSGNLDRAASDALHELLWNLSRKDKRTLIIVTHNHELAENADKVVEIFDGSIKNVQYNQIV
ncbi:ABC transporter ATP-binding protein [candidate division KSB1 bacterium]|nr:ABC transporter ATP-binding protein [candidate division KSB1 bacterium]